MAIIPGTEDEVFFGAVDTPLPDWREKRLPEDDSDDDIISPEEKEIIEGLIGFSLDDAFPEDDEEEDDDDTDDFEIKRGLKIKPSGLAQRKSMELDKLNQLYEDFRSLDYDQIDVKVKEAVSGLDSLGVIQLASKFGLRASSKSEAIKEIISKIKDRKESWERIQFRSDSKGMRIRKREVDEAAAAYSNVLIQYGESNQATLRAEIKYRELKEKWEAQEGKKYDSMRKDLGSITDYPRKTLTHYQIKAGFTGRKRDKVGHTHCYSDGVHVPCKQEKPKQDKPKKEKPKEEWKKQSDGGYTKKVKGGYYKIEPHKDGFALRVGGAIVETADSAQALIDFIDKGEKIEKEKPKEESPQSTNQSEALSSWIDEYNKHGAAWDESQMTEQEIDAWDAAYDNPETRELVQQPPGYEKRKQGQTTEEVPGRSTEEITKERAENNYEQMKSDYLKNKEVASFDKDGNLSSVVINTDEWRGLFPEYTGTNSGEVHNASSYLNKRFWKESLQTMRGIGNNSVVVLAGGGGSGKGTAVGQYMDQEKYPIRLDQVSDEIESLERKVDEAKKEGFNVDYVFIDRKPQDAWIGGVISRALSARKRGEMARTVPIEIAIKANIESRKTAAELLKRRKDVPVYIIDNNHGWKKAKVYTDRDEAVKFLESSVYDTDSIRKEMTEQTLALYDKGEIPEDIAMGLLGKEIIRKHKGGEQ